MLTRENANLFVELYLKHYSELDKKQLEVIYRGIEEVIGKQRLAICSPEIMSLRACSPAEFSVKAMKSITKMRFPHELKKDK